MRIGAARAGRCRSLWRQHGRRPGVRARAPRPAAALPGFARGLRAAAQGGAAVLKAPSSSLTRLAGAAVAATVALDAGGLWAVHNFAPDAAQAGGLLAAVASLALAASLDVAVVVLSPVAGLALAQAVLPLLAERVFLDGVKARAADTLAEELERADGLAFQASLASAGRKLRAAAQLEVLCVPAGTLLHAVPVAGGVVAGALQLGVAAYVLGWELLDPYLEKRATSAEDAEALVRKNAGAVIGFALPYAAAVTVPLVGPLVVGIAQGAAGFLVVDVLEEGR